MPILSIYLSYNKVDLILSYLILIKKKSYLYQQIKEFDYWGNRSPHLSRELIILKKAHQGQIRRALFSGRIACPVQNCTVPCKKMNMMS